MSDTFVSFVLFSFSSCMLATRTPRGFSGRFFQFELTPPEASSFNDGKNVDPDLPGSILNAINAHTIETLKLGNRVPPSEDYGSAGILTSSSIGYTGITPVSS